MVSLRLIPKILFKPAEAFEELKEETNGEDGVLTFILISIIALMLFGFISSAVRINLMPVQFGFGAELSLANLFIYMPIEFLTIIITAGIASKIAKRFGGIGNFAETFSFFCYGSALNIIRAISSGIFAVWFRFKINMGLIAINEGNSPDVQFLTALPQFSMIISLFFIAWSVWIIGNAISIGHETSKRKGIIIAIVAITLTFALRSALTVLWVVK